jgi:tetratricopeptide (TPR) repeat protein
MPMLLALLLLAQDPRELSKSAAEKREKGDLDGAIADLDRAIAIQPQSLSLWNERGRYKYEKGDFDGAIADLTKVIEGSGLPKWTAQVHELRGFARMAKEDLDGALADLNHAVRLDPDYTVYLSDRAMIHSARADWDAAIADYTKAHEKEPQFSTPLAGRAVARSRKGDDAGALEDADRALQIEPDYPQHLAGRAEVHLVALRLDRALADLEKAAGKEPDRKVWSAIHLWILRSRLGKRAEADRELREALKTIAARKELELSLAPTRFLLGELPEADFLKAAAARDQAPRKVWTALARFLIGMKHLADGKREEGLSNLRASVDGADRSLVEYAWAQAELKAARR